MSKSLFSSTTIGSIPVRNRIAMAPLTRARANLDGTMPVLAAEYYAQRASAGLIIAEATTISDVARGCANVPGLYTQAHVDSWKPITDAVHAKGGRIVLQVMHSGRFSHTSLQPNGQAPVAPSAVQAEELAYTTEGFVRPSMPRALRLDEIPGIIEEYVTAARNALAAGFDGIEVHAANSYLLDQFIRDSTNHRTDAYGGSAENRTRLPFEVAEALVATIGGDKVGFRLSPITKAAGNTPFDSDPQRTYGLMAKRLGTLDLAYLHCVEGQTRGDNAHEHFDFQALRKAYSGSYIANNGINRELAMKIIEDGRADLVAFGRSYITNPDLVERFRDNLPLAPDADREVLYGGGARGYSDWPAAS